MTTLAETPTTIEPAPRNSGTHFSIETDILSTNAEALKEQLAVELANAPTPIGVFELSLFRTRMVDSVGLNLLVWLIKQVRARGGRLRISLSDTNVQRTFQFTRLDREAEVVRVTGEN